MIHLVLTGQILLWLVVLGVFLASGQASIFHPLCVYLAFHAMVFVVRPLQILLLDFDFGWKYIGIDPSETDLIKTFLVTSVALIVFAVASLAVGRSHVRFSRLPPEPFTLDQKRGLLMATLILGPLVLYSIYRANTGGFVGEERGHVFVLTGDSGYVVEAQFMAGSLICAWMAVSRFSRRGILPMLLYFGYRSYTGWMRWTIVLVAFALAMTYAWQTRRRWLPVGAILAVIPALLIFHSLGRGRTTFRHWIEGTSPPSTAENLEPGLRNSEKLKRKYDGPDYANFDFVTFILSVVPARTESFTYGSQYLQLFTEPIPRKLWPGKPLGVPIVFFDLNRYGNFMGMTPTLVGDGWMSGGWVGLIITIGLVGGLLGFAHRQFWMRTQNNQFALLYIVGVAMLPQWFRDGGIAIAKFLFWNLSPLFFWVLCTWLVRGRMMPSFSVLIRPGRTVRLIESGDSRQ
jgi:hypothetical protein